VSLGVLGKNENDKIDDFEELWTFAEAFDIPFRPQATVATYKKVSPRRESSSPAKGDRNRSGQATASSEKE